MRYVLPDTIVYAEYGDFANWWKSASVQHQDAFCSLCHLLTTEENAMDWALFKSKTEPASIPKIKAWYSTVKPNTKDVKHGIVTAVLGNNLIGCSLVEFYASSSLNEVFINTVIVEEAYRGQGIGTELIQRSIRVANALVPNCLVLLRVGAGNEQALKLYRKLGFTTTRAYILQLK